MEVYPDFKELLRLFNKNRIDYIIVGAYALAFHGSPRYTGDLDILVKPEQDNAANIQSVFKTVACLLTRRRRVNKHVLLYSIYKDNIQHAYSALRRLSRRAD